MAHGFSDLKEKVSIDSMLENLTNNFTAQINSLQNKVNDYWKTIYPVGSIYMSTTNKNPASIFGGTWVAWGAGRVPVGVDSTQSEFNTVQKTGGSKTHTLTAAQIPSHNHVVDLRGANNNFSGGYSEFYIRHGQSEGIDIVHSGHNSTVDEYAINGWGTLNHGIDVDGNDYSHWADRVVLDISNTLNAYGNTSSTGSGTPHNNLQPYITCYMWRRTA